MKRVIVLFSSFLFSFAAWAESVSVLLNANADSLLIGDQLKLSVKASHPLDQSINWNQFDDFIGTFELVKLLSIDSQQDGNQISEQANFLVSAYDSGLYSVDSQLFVVQSKIKNDSFLLFSNAIYFNTLAVDTSQPIKPIKEPISVPFSVKENWQWFVIPLFILLLLALIVYLFFFRKKSEKPRELKIITRPAHEVAMEKLLALQQKALWKEEKTKEHYLLFSEILREYLEKRYRILALESSTTDLLEMLRSKNMHKKQRALLKEILEASDLVKFAKNKPTEETHLSLMEEAKNLIRITKQKEGA